ncbi:MAG TPA: hypothetical protein VFS19_03890 [Planctomycetota bacterium]|nr:hypothetical protein [Planctomycetota bacterium]
MGLKGGAALGAAAAVAVTVAGVATGVPLGGTLVRAVLAGAAGLLLGWLIFGKLVEAAKNEGDEGEKK